MILRPDLRNALLCFLAVVSCLDIEISRHDQVRKTSKRAAAELLFAVAATAETEQQLVANTIHDGLYNTGKFFL